MENGGQNQVPYQLGEAAPKSLVETRRSIAKCAADAAGKRLNLQREGALAYEHADMNGLEARISATNKQAKRLAGLVLAGTEAGFARPVSSVVGVDGCVYASDWSGTLYQIDAAEMKRCKQAKVSNGRTCLSPSRHAGLLYCGSDDGVTLSVDLAPKDSIKCEARVASTDEHPHLDVLAAGVYDHTFKLFDVCTMQLVLSQASAEKPIHAVKFHPDGALLTAAGHDGRAKIWDLRSGQPVLELAKHKREIYTTDWHPNGYTLATGGADCTIYEWDVRNKREVMLPAHTSVVTSLNYQGEFLLSGSYDSTIKVWHNSTLVKAHTLTDKVMSFAYTSSGLVAGKKDCTVEFLE